MRTILGATVVISLIGAGSRPALGQIEREWAVRYDSPGSGLETVNAMAVDPEGNTYLVGFTDPWSSSSRRDPDGVNSDFLVLKVDAVGNQVWLRRHDGEAHGADTARALTLDPTGGIAVVGTVSTPMGKSCAIL